jgi:hypothetical protein
VTHSRTSFGRWLAGSAVGCTLLFGGCADGIDLNGKVFDMMGISPSAAEARKFEPQVAERAPLVMPPDSNRLPAPGSGQAPVAEMAWPDDPEARKLREAQERQRLHLAYCRGDVQWKERVLNKEAVGAPRSPYGACPTLIGGATLNGAAINKE